MSYSNYQLNQKINNLQNQINGGATLLATNNTWAGTNTFDNNLRLNSTLTDSSGDVGTAGQVLSSTSTATNWITVATGSTYIAYTASATIPTTTNPTLIVLFSGTTAGQTLTIPTLAYSTGQVIQFKNRASVNVTISSGLSTMFLYAPNSSNVTNVSSYTLIPNDTYNLYWIGFAYVQYTPSNTFSTLASPVYNSAIDTASGITALTIGSNVINGNIVIGSALGIGDVSIASAQAIGGTVTIGSANSETTINGTTKLTGPLNVNSSTGSTDQYLASQGASTPIWKTIPSSTWVGTATSNLDMGIYSISAPTINSISNTSTLSICSSQTTGIINIGTGSRLKSISTNQGDINIGTGLNAAFSGSISPIISIGNNTTAGNTTEISIGASATKTTINGPLFLTGAISATGLITADGGIQLPSGDSINVVGNITGSGNISTSGNISVSGTGAIATASAGSFQSNSYESRTTGSSLSIGSSLLTSNILIGSSTALSSTLIKLKSPDVSNPSSVNTTQSATNTTLYGGLMFSNVGVAYTISSNINREYFLVITGATKTITLPTLTIHQIINIKVFSASTMNITAPVVGTLIYPKTGGSSTTTYVMPADSTQKFYCDGSAWYGF